jgi:flagellar basal body-associated protein FliL
MAEEDEAAGEEEAGPKGGGGPGRYFVLVLLILLAEGVVGFWVIDRAIPAPEVPQEQTREEEEKEEVVWKPPIYYEALEGLIVEPTSPRGKSMVRLSIALHVDDQVVVDELTLRHVIIWDLVLRRLEILQESDFRDPEKKKLKNDLLQAINAELKNPGVLGVLITDIILQ